MTPPPPGRPAALLWAAAAALLLAAQAVRAATDSELLLAFKNTFTNGNEVLASWNATSSPCAGGWLGVSCASGQVTDL